MGDTGKAKLQELNYGVIGIGRMGQRHAMNILQLVPRAKLVSACSPAQPDLDWAAIHLVPHGVAVFATVDEMLAHPVRLDAVVIASLTELHHVHARQCLERGIHVLCEKPIAQTVAQLDDLMAFVQQAGPTGPRLMVGFTRRFDENFLDANEKIRAGAIGAPVVIRSQGLEKLDDGFAMHNYLYGSARAGGFFVDSVIHELDLTLSFLEAGSADGRTTPQPQSVCAYGTISHFTELANDDPQVRDADNIVGMVQFWGGAISFHYNSRTAAVGYDNQLEIFGSHGKISVNLVPRRNRLELADSTGVHVEALPNWSDRYKPCFVTEVTAFTDCILDDKPTPISLEAAKISLTIAQALQESFRTGKKIDFDEKGNRKN